MANSGNFTSSNYQGRAVRFEWSVASQSIEGNYTDINWTFKGYGGSSTWYYTHNAYLNVNGSRVYTQGSGSIKLSNGTVLKTGTTRIYHNPDGTKSFGADGGAGIYTNAVNCTGSGSWDLPTIPRASSFSVSGNTINSQISVSISRASSSFTHTLIYQLGSVTRQYTGLTTSASFTPPITDANEFPSNSTSKNATLTLITYNGSTEIGRKAIDYTMYLGTENDYNPTFTYTLSDSENLDYGSYVQNVSYLSGVITASGQYGATIKSYSIRFDDNVYTSANFTTNRPISQSGSVSGTIVVTDTRDKTTTQTFTINVLAYNKPIINTFSVARNSATPSNAIANINIAVTSLNSNNSKTFLLKYKSSNDNSYTTITLDNTNYTLNTTQTIVISENYSYNFKLQISDDFYTTEREINISSAFALINANASGKGVAFGKVSEINDAMEIQMDLYYKGNRIDGMLNSTPVKYCNASWVLYNDNWTEANFNELKNAIQSWQFGMVDYRTIIYIFDANSTSNIITNMTYEPGISYPVPDPIYNTTSVPHTINISTLTYNGTNFIATNYHIEKDYDTSVVSVTSSTKTL
jgi:hypothetical protein